MNLHANETNGAILVTVEEARIDAACAIQFKDQMRDVTEGDSSRVIVDMTKVNFLDSSGLGAVVAAKKQLGSGRSMELACLSPTVRKVFRLTRMDSIFPIHDDVQSALDQAHVE